MKKASVFNIRDLSIGFQSRHHRHLLFENINAEAMPGEFIALIGQNGIGKSTLLKTLMHILKPLSGHIELNQKPLSKYNRLERSHEMGFVSTEIVMAGHLSVENLVSLGRIPHTNWFGHLASMDRDKIEWALTTTKLDHIRHKNIGEISDGERQRTMIARSVAQDTRILILDEPTAFLDLPSRFEMLNLLKNLAKEEGKTIIFSTHDLNLVLHEVDKIWMMAGDQFRQGAPEDLMINDALTHLFPQEWMKISSSDGRFIFPRKFSQTIQLDSTRELLYWTQNALERKGFQVTHEKNMGLKVRAASDQDGYFWKLYRTDRTSTVVYRTLYDLLNAICNG